MKSIINQFRILYYSYLIILIELRMQNLFISLDIFILPEYNHLFKLKLYYLFKISKIK